MTTLAARLQLRAGSAIELVNVPDGLALDLPIARAGAAPDDALLVFTSTGAALPEHALRLAAACDAGRLTWIAYPKAGQLATDLNRDRLVAALAPLGLQPVRQIAIDEVWSALRLRNA